MRRIYRVPALAAGAVLLAGSTTAVALAAGQSNGSPVVRPAEDVRPTAEPADDNGTAPASSSRPAAVHPVKHSGTHTVVRPAARPDDNGGAVEPGDDKGGAVEPGDDKGGAVEPGDDNGGAVEPGDDNGGAVEPGDDNGGAVEAGDDGGRHGGDDGSGDDSGRGGSDDGGSHG